MDEKIKKIKEDLKFAISDYCQYRVRVENSCDDGDCEFCPMNKAYDMAVELGEEEEEE